MKKNLTKLLAGILLILFADSCRKGQTPVTTQTKNAVKEKTNQGAILNRDAYLKVPIVNFNEIRSTLLKNVPSSKLRVNAIPPSSVYLNHPPADNHGQDTTGACVSFSIGYALMGTLDNEFPIAGVDPVRSPWFLFQLDHSFVHPNCNALYGMQPDEGMSMAGLWGVASRDIDYWLGWSPCIEPTSAQFTNAATNTIGSFYRVTNISDLKTALSYRLPVEMGLRSYPSLKQAFNSGTIYTAFNPDGSNVGHAVCIVGYDDAKHAFLVQNSWGTEGGDPDQPGMMWFDYDLFSDGNLGNPDYGIELYVATPNIPKFPVSDLACAGTDLYSVGLYNVGGGGNAVYQWANNSWRRLPGAGIAIAGYLGLPLLVNNENTIYTIPYGGSNWVVPVSSPPRGITDIAMSSQYTFAISNDPINGGGYSIWALRNGTWVQIDGTAVKIIADSNGVPWVINYYNYCYRYNGTIFQLMPGRITDIASGGGNTFALGINVINPGGYEIYKWNGSDWTLVSGTASKIAVDSNGIPYCVNFSGHLYKGNSSGSSWTQLN